ncbi:hypothetical protein TIFTF001_040407 [Ficus carica]|uniref:Uncharacterized protein n=1 Tax=Ficus carica TaxID=3494 RepID=A0AA88CNA3_FICCA|nr:hypothetical protein TIFTF001_040407 [Ficus carica]
MVDSWHPLPPLQFPHASIGNRRSIWRSWRIRFSHGSPTPLCSIVIEPIETHGGCRVGDLHHRRCSRRSFCILSKGARGAKMARDRRSAWGSRGALRLHGRPTEMTGN